MEGRIVPGENYIYSPIFQMAWDKVRDELVKEPLKIEGAPELATIMNRSKFDPGNLDTNRALVAGGYVADGAVDDIRKRFVQKFGTDEPVRDMLDQWPPAYTKKDFVMLAYLQVALRFEEPFFVFQQPLRFNSSSGSSNVEAVGASYFSAEDGRNEKRWDQVVVNDYRNDSDFILTLVSYPQALSHRRVRTADMPPTEEIIVAMVQPGKTLNDTWASVQNRMVNTKQHYSDYFIPNEIVKVPKIRFDKSAKYDELLWKQILNDEFTGLVIIAACQSVKFEFNEKGVDLETTGWLGAAGAGPPKYIPPPRRMVVDRPFLMALRRPGKEPYLVLWIENPVFFTTLAVTQTADAYANGHKDADAALRKGVKVWKVRDDDKETGLASGAEGIRREVRLDRFGVRTELAASGIDAEFLDSYIHGYNARMTGEMKAVFGPDVLARIEEMVEGKCERNSYLWLKYQQNKDGSWGTLRKTKPLLTGLCLLTLMARGETKTSEQFGECLDKGVAWLIKATSPGKPSQNADLPANTIAEMCLLQAYYSDREDKEYASAATDGLRSLLKNEKDHSYWYLLALRLAQRTGLSGEEVQAKIADLSASTVSALDKSVAAEDVDRTLYWCLAQHMFLKKLPDGTTLDFINLHKESSWTEAGGMMPVQRRYMETIVYFFMGGEKWSDWLRTGMVEMFNARESDGVWNHPSMDNCEEARMFNDADRRIYTTAMARLISDVYYCYLVFLQSDADRE
jgi:hypothetical protein